MIPHVKYIGIIRTDELYIIYAEKDSRKIITPYMKRRDVVHTLKAWGQLYKIEGIVTESEDNTTFPPDFKAGLEGLIDLIKKQNRRH